MALIKIYVTVSPVADVLQRYNQIRIYRSTDGINGTYSLVETMNLRPGESIYTWYDDSGASTYWYKTTYYNSTTADESGYSDPHLGDDAEILSHIMTVQNLKDIYLTGLDLTDDQGNPYPDIMYDFGIRAAVDWAEQVLDINVRPTEYTELQDYDLLNWQQMAFIQLDHYPVIPPIDYIKMIWPSSNEPYEFPDEWIRLQAGAGQINLVPTSGTLAQAMLIAGAYLPTILSNIPYVPNAIEIKYTAGFAYGDLPYNIRDLIGMKASFPIFNTAGDLIAGAGIANYSLSVDGLSQSVGTTSSATNSGYGARLLQYEKQIKAGIPIVKKFYKNVGLAMA